MQKSFWMNTLLLLVICLQLFGCGAVSEFPPGRSWLKKDPDNPEKIPLQLSLNRSSQNLNLVGLSAASYLMDVTLCSSGFAQTLLSTPVVELYKGDRNCQLELRSFVWSGKTWSKKPDSSNFFGPTPALFMNSSDTEEILVRRVGTIPSPVTSGTAAGFAFNLIDVGLSKRILNFNAAPQKRPTLDSLWDAPHLQLKSVILDSLNNTTKVTQFLMDFECLNPTVNDSCETAELNQNQDLTSMRVILVDDNYGGNITWAQAQSVASSATGNSANVGVGEILQPGPGFLGGFRVLVQTPHAITDNTNLLAIIEHHLPEASERSYSYFTIRMSVLALEANGPPE